MKTTWRGKAESIPLLALNVVILGFVFILFTSYVTGYQERLREENLINIANLNQSAANTATAMLASWDNKLADVVLYLSSHELTREEALDYVYDTNSNDIRVFELIGADYTGYVARRDSAGELIPVSYAHSSYAELQKIFDEAGAPTDGARFLPEFTDSHLAVKLFALSTSVQVINDDGEKAYCTLLIGAKTTDVNASFNNQDVFDGMSSVIISPNGQYIVSNSDFKSDNFFRYLYLYNDLTRDQRNALEAEMIENGSGEFFYANSMAQQCVYRYVRMPGSEWFCVTCVPVSSFRPLEIDNAYIIASVVLLLVLLAMDVWFLSKLNRRLRVSIQREVEAGNAKMEFLSRMSHDIRTPLNGIIGMTLLAQDEVNTPNTQKFLEYIKVSGNFLMGLVNDVLDMSKVESGKLELHPEPYTAKDFEKYISAVVTPLCREKNHEFNMNAPEESYPVMFDRLRLNQIFFNLLSNAVKYTPNGGKIELTWQNEIIEGDRVALDFVVRDNGIGMSEEFQRRMFESFSQENHDATVVGTGLGLSIVKSLVDLMGGQIRAESAPGSGTTFFIHLETTLCSADNAETADDSGTDLTGKRILVCEDNNINALISQGILEKYGAAVEIAENGRAGYEQFSASTAGYFDAILMDVQMPVMNGLEATRAIRAIDRSDARRIPIVAMTANAYDTDVMNCLAAGMNAHAGKPIQPEPLCELLVKLIRDNAVRR